MTERYRRRDPRPLAGALVVWLWVTLAFEVLGIATQAYELSVYGRWAETGVLPDNTGLLLVSALSIPAIVVYVVTAILFLKWTYRVNANAHRLATQGMTTTPGWAVGWYFVPFANLWKPFAGLDQAWRVSHDPDAWRSTPTPDRLRTWWALWLSSAVLGQIAFRIGLAATTPEWFVNSVWIGLAGSVLAIFLDLQVIGIVRKLTSKQVETMHTRPISAAAAAPYEELGAPSDPAPDH